MALLVTSPQANALSPLEKGHHSTQSYQSAHPKQEPARQTQCTVGYCRFGDGGPGRAIRDSQDPVPFEKPFAKVFKFPECLIPTFKLGIAL